MKTKGLLNGSKWVVSRISAKRGLIKVRNKERHKFLTSIARIQSDKYIADIKSRMLEQNDKHLIPYGYKLYSQNDEDGIINEIFRRIGTSSKRFVELGCGDGTQNNTLALLFQGWSGVWVDADTNALTKIEQALKTVIQRGQLTVCDSFITIDNVDQLISGALAKDLEIDLFSIDLDGNDLHILEAISSIQPRAIIVEYNAKFYPPIKYCMQYAKEHRWNSDDCFGASLKSFELSLIKKGYSLVGCNVTGVNAFFVRNDLLNDNFAQPYTAEYHFQPERYHLSETFISGHPASLSTLETAVVESD